MRNWPRDCLALFEKAIAAIPLVMLLGFFSLMWYAGRDQSFDCAVELGAGSVYLKTDAGPSGCWKAYEKFESLKGRRVRVGLCGYRALFIDAEWQRLFEDRSTRSEYRRAAPSD